MLEIQEREKSLERRRGRSAGCFSLLFFLFCFVLLHQLLVQVLCDVIIEVCKSNRKDTLFSFIAVFSCESTSRGRQLIFIYKCFAGATKHMNEKKDMTFIQIICF